MIEIYKLEKKEREELYVRATHFNLFYNRSKSYEDVYKHIAEQVGVHSSKELWCVITNIARALKQDALRLQIPKDNQAYVGNRQQISRRKMFLLLDSMVDSGYFVFYKGGFINVKKEEYTSSLYEMTDKLKILWKDVDINEKLEYNGDLIEIKDRETKKYLNANIRGTSVHRALVCEYNSVLCRVRLELDGIILPAQQYKRVYSDSLSYGGRFYNVAGGVQTMKQEDRKRLMINGEKVVELDFKALHPSILYEKTWQENPILVERWIEQAWDGVYNPYITKGYDDLLYIVDDEIAEHLHKHGLVKYNPIRNLFKFAVMTCLNAKRGEKRPLQPASNALTSEWYDDKKKDVVDRKYVGLYPVGDKFPARDICELVQAANLPIEEHFFSDVGISLQRIDSDIVERVIQALLDKGEVLYPEHDSVIVRESLEHEVTQLMRKAYFDVIGSDQFCVVEKK